MFSNLIIYRTAQQWQGSLEQVEEALQKTPFMACGATQEHAEGYSFARPRAQPAG